MPRTQIPGSLIKDNTVTGNDLMTGAPGQILVADNIGQLTPVTMTGDASITNAGVITVSGGGNPSLLRVTTKTASSTLTSADAGLITCDATTSAFTLTLPAASVVPGYTFMFVKADTTANIVSITAPANNFIDYSATYSISRYSQIFTVRSNGTKWVFVDGGVPKSHMSILDMPSYYSPVSGIYESTHRYQLTWQSSSTGSRNVYLPNYGTFSSQSPDGFLLPRNAILKTAWGQFTAAVTGTVAFQLTRNGATTILFTLNVAQGAVTAVSENINVKLNAGDKLSMYLSAASNVSKPQITLEFAWRE
jgi:hypothetical protein